jgi:hypothetical protein
MRRQAVVITLSLVVLWALAACAALQVGWYKPGMTQQEFAQDKYECMSASQMQASSAYVNAYAGAANSGTTTNMPLFQACLEARGYVWTNRAAVDRYEASQQPPTYYSPPPRPPTPAAYSSSAPEHKHTEAEIQQARMDAFNGCMNGGKSASQVCKQRADEVESLMRTGGL